jgi:hypothetical protein
MSVRDLSTILLQAYNILRSESSFFITLFQLMLSTGSASRQLSLSRLLCSKLHSCLVFFLLTDTCYSLHLVCRLFANRYSS